MKFIAMSVAAVSMSVTACTAEQVGTPVTSLAPSSAGLISSTDLFELFLDTCLTQFPDGQATKAAFKRAGLKTIQRNPIDAAAYGDELGSFEDVNRRLIAGFGPIVYELSEDYDGGPLKRAECSVAAEIADPKVNWAPLVASLNVRFPSLSWTTTSALDATFERDGATFDVLVEPQVRGFTWEDATPRCDEDNCGDWDEAKLSIGITK